MLSKCSDSLGDKDAKVRHFGNASIMTFVWDNGKVEMAHQHHQFGTKTCRWAWFGWWWGAIILALPAGGRVVTAPRPAQGSPRLRAVLHSTCWALSQEHVIQHATEESPPRTMPIRLGPSLADCSGCLGTNPSDIGITQRQSEASPAARACLPAVCRMPRLSRRDDSSSVCVRNFALSVGSRPCSFPEQPKYLLVFGVRPSSMVSPEERPAGLTSASDCEAIRR